MYTTHVTFHWTCFITQITKLLAPPPPKFFFFWGGGADRSGSKEVQVPLKGLTFLLMSTLSILLINSLVIYVLTYPEIQQIHPFNISHCNAARIIGKNTLEPWRILATLILVTHHSQSMVTCPNVCLTRFIHNDTFAWNIRADSNAHCLFSKGYSLKKL